MKSAIIVLMLLGAVIVGGTIVYLNHQKTPPPAPVADSTPVPTPERAPSEKAAAAEPPPAAISENGDKPTQKPVAPPVAEETKSVAANAIAKMVDALLSAKSAAEKHEMFQQLLKSGQMDQAIAELKQRAAESPDDPKIPTTIGEAMINQVGAIHAAGGDINEQGILAMQADQNFNAALKIDPQNFEAQLVKSISMSYWPADPARDAQVVQTLSGLIDRQETMPSRPDFAQTYIYLGNEYQKIGQPDKAAATWQLGLQKFPGNAALQNKISGQ